MGQVSRAVPLAYHLTHSGLTCHGLGAITSGLTSDTHTQTHMCNTQVAPSHSGVLGERPLRTLNHR